MTALSSDSPVCADCGEAVWYNPRKRRYQHYFEHGCTQAIPNAPATVRL